MAIHLFRWTEEQLCNFIKSSLPAIDRKVSTQWKKRGAGAMQLNEYYGNEKNLVQKMIYLHAYRHSVSSFSFFSGGGGAPSPVLS